MTDWINQRNESITKENLIRKCPAFAVEPVAWYATRAIMQALEKAGMPKCYMVDVAQDICILHSSPCDRFVYGIRDSGTVLVTPPGSAVEKPEMYMIAADNLFAPQWYIFNIHDVRKGDNYNEPQLRPVSYEEALEFFRTQVLAGNPQGGG